ncbi:MAG TPA: hypothetical protein VMT27_07000, partial [Actinomycetes bacterium]|nr:hypothetical protein [Actinomycetes bacterium]
ARDGALSHTPDLGSRVCCWTWLGENAAYAGSVQSLHNALMASAPHRYNILYPDADDVGVAVVSANGELWAAEVFRARAGGTSSSDRQSDASSTSRSGQRSTPTTSTTGVAPSSSGTVTAYVPTHAELIRQQLRQQIHQRRVDLRNDKQRHGPYDPVRAAVRYAGTLDQVSK